MAYVHTAAAPRPLTLTAPKTGPGLIRRLIAAMQAARLRQAESEIAHFLAGNGGKLTDEAEREIERRFLSNPSHI
jgi:hypothetical protein